MTKCATKRIPLEEPRRLTVSASAVARRVQRLHRGVDRWALAQRWRAVRVRHSHLFTFTCARSENDDLWGEWQRVAHAIRSRCGPQVYYVWLELTEIGRIHYHMLWLNAPWFEREAPAVWLTRVWGHGNVDQRFRGRRRSLDDAVQYVRGYVKKHGAKAYQQDYAQVPPGMRAFASSRKGFAPELLDRHLDRWEAWFVDGAVVLTARLTHERRDVCAPSPWEREQARRKARYRAGRKLGRVWANAEVSYRPNDHALKGGSARGPARPAGRPSSQLELLSEYAVWAWRVESLPW